MGQSIPGAQGEAERWRSEIMVCVPWPRCSRCYQHSSVTLINDFCCSISRQECWPGWLLLQEELRLQLHSPPTPHINYCCSPLHCDVRHQPVELQTNLREVWKCLLNSKTTHRELPRIFSSRTELAPGHFSLDMGYFSYVCLKLKKVVVLNWK